MLSFTRIVLFLSCLMMITYARSLNSPDQLIPLLFSSVNPDEAGILPPPPSDQNRLIFVVEKIIRYVSSIKSAENFIDNIVNRQKDVAERMKVLTFLHKCFELTHNVIQREIDFMLGVETIIKKPSNPSSPFTLEELQQAQSKINELVLNIEKRMATLKTWIPPTMPFLGFF